MLASQVVNIYKFKRPTGYYRMARSQTEKQHQTTAITKQQYEH